MCYYLNCDFKKYCLYHKYQHNTNTVHLCCRFYIFNSIFQHISHCRQRTRVSMWRATSDALCVRSERTPHLRNLSPPLKLMQTHTYTHVTHMTHAHRDTKTDRAAVNIKTVHFCTKHKIKLKVWQFVCSERKRRRWRAVRQRDINLMQTRSAAVVYW